MENIEIDLPLLQKVLTKALDEVKRICDKNAIVFFLVGGSALGAVRHQGFIPWDDDIDIAMYRQDYERFVELAKKELDAKFFLQTPETDKYYPLSYAKICVNNTKYIQTNFSKRTMHHGIFIDVYPIDAVPDDLKLRKKQKLHGLLSYFFLRNECIVNHGAAVKLASKIALLILPYSVKRRLGIKYDEKCARYCIDDCACLSNLYGIKLYDKEIMPKEYIGNPVLAQFEEKEYLIPEQYDNYLTHLYGDYMTLPKEEDRQMKHFAVEFDLGSYSE